MLRKVQSQSYFKDLTGHALFRHQFGLPDEETVIVEISATFSLDTKDDSYTGRLSLTQEYLTFQSLDRRSCKFAIPLFVIRRVEKVSSSSPSSPFPTSESSAWILRLGLWYASSPNSSSSKPPNPTSTPTPTIEGPTSINLQLNGLKSSCEQFSSHMRDRLKVALPKMKGIKPLMRTFYSEWFLDGVSAGAGKFAVGFDETPGLEAGEKEGGVAAAGAAGAGPVVVGEEGKTESGEEEGEDGKDRFTTRSGLGNGYHGGLGLIYRYPGDPKKLREKAKMRLWRDYFRAHGRNLTLIRFPTFTRLLQVGLPSRLRGEFWELTSGSVHLRHSNPGTYESLLSNNIGKKSMATEEIEKDLNRSLPEYPAYGTSAGGQQGMGIDTLRRVLSAYSWWRPEEGYCQAQNIVVAAFLIFTSEEQCFWLLNVLCERYVPGYYSPSMFGSLLDQKVFEHLVQRCLPVIHEHFRSVDVQISVASLPWFLSLYISSMPLVFAFRIVDCFFLMGPRVLFQIGLAILKINGEELLQITDDGMFISIMRNYFSSLGDSAYPNSDDPRMRAITKFQSLLVTAFREFGIITEETVNSERKRFRAEVVESIENFAKRAAIRNLKEPGRFDKNELGMVFDHFQFAYLKSKDVTGASHGDLVEKAKAAGGSQGASRGYEADGTDKPELRIDRKAFGIFLSDIASWARDETVVKNGFVERVHRKVADGELIDRLYFAWDRSKRGVLSYQDVVVGLDQVMFGDLMSNIETVFSLHDKNKDGYLTKDEVLQLSEDLLFVFRNEPGDQYLASVSGLLNNCFEYAEETKRTDKSGEDTKSSETPTASDAPPSEGPTPSEPSKSHNRSRSGSIVEENPHRPYLNLATFRMVVLSDPLLESFFDTDLVSSFKLEPLVAEPEQKSVKPKGLGGMGIGFLNSFVDAIMTDENKERFNRLADAVGTRLDIHEVAHRPSIGKIDASTTLENRARHPHSSAPPSATPATSASSPASASTASLLPSTASSATTTSTLPTSTSSTSLAESTISASSVGSGLILADAQAAAEGMLSERPKFKDDEIAENDEEEDDGDDDAALGLGGQSRKGGEGDGEGDDKIMDEVDSFLMANAGDVEGDVDVDDV